MNIDRVPPRNYFRDEPNPANVQSFHPKVPADQPKPLATVSKSPAQSFGVMASSFEQIFGMLRELLGQLKKMLEGDNDSHTNTKQIVNVEVPAKFEVPAKVEVPIKVHVRTEPKTDKKLTGFYASAGTFGQEQNVETHAATIRAAMTKFGNSAHSVFQSFECQSGNYSVVMRDGYKVNFSCHEYDEVVRRAKFEGDDPRAIQTANLIMAAFIKRKQQGDVNYPGYESFSAALDASLKGEFEKRMLEGMGLTAYMRQALPEDLQDENAIGVISTGYQRSAAVIGGAMERHGKTVGKPTRSHGYVLV